MSFRWHFFASKARHRTSIHQMSLQIALLHEGTVAVVAVEGSLSAVHAHVSFDAEQLGVSSPACCTFEQLVWSPGTLVAGEDFHITSVHTVAVLFGGEHILVVSQVRVFLAIGEGVDEFLLLGNHFLVLIASQIFKHSLL